MGEKRMSKVLVISDRRSTSLTKALSMAWKSLFIEFHQTRPVGPGLHLGQLSIRGSSVLEQESMGVNMKIDLKL